MRPAECTATGHCPSTTTLVTHYPADRGLNSFPTRRSSDLERIRDHEAEGHQRKQVTQAAAGFSPFELIGAQVDDVEACSGLDRKSTRLKSSHMSISYAVFCLKQKRPPRRTRRQIR